MQTSQAAQLSDLIRQKVGDFKQLCEGLDEKTSSLAPSGRWSPKEIVSHPCGPEGIGHMPTFYTIVKEDRPLIDIVVDNPFFSEDRARKTFDELLGEFDKEYDRIAEFVAGLSEEQLSRQAHMPVLKESPLGEYPTLAGWVQGLCDYHIGWHTDHMREVLEALGARCGFTGKNVGEEVHAVSPSHSKACEGVGCQA